MRWFKRGIVREGWFSCLLYLLRLPLVSKAPAPKGNPPSAKKQKAAPKAKAVKTVKTKTAPAKTKIVKTTTKGKGKQTAPNADEDRERKYGLTADKVAELRKAKAYCAYRPTSSYATVVEALHSLGANKWHDSPALVAEYGKQADRDALKTFKTREVRNENGLDNWKDKVVQNATVTCRAKDYGLKQVQIGWQVKMQREDGALQFGLFKVNGK